MMYFSREEFKCKCGRCGKGYDDMSPIILDRLEFARNVAGIPFVLSSAMRCEEHNRKVGGSPTSSHLHGLAVDIKVGNSEDRLTILKALLDVGSTRIGISKDFIHIDVDFHKAGDVCWVY